MHDISNINIRYLSAENKNNQEPLFITLKYP